MLLTIVIGRILVALIDSSQFSDILEKKISMDFCGNVIIIAEIP